MIPDTLWGVWFGFPLIATIATAQNLFIDQTCVDKNSGFAGDTNFVGAVTQALNFAVIAQNRLIAGMNAGTDQDAANYWNWIFGTPSSTKLGKVAGMYTGQRQKHRDPLIMFY